VQLRIAYPERVLGEYKDKPVKFYWISVESPEQITNAALKRYAKERKLNFPVLRDSSQAVFMQFSARVRLPMIVVLDKGWQCRWTRAVRHAFASRRIQDGHSGAAR
jgi:hypothetical protein